MNGRLLELALRKQRLQFQSDLLRARWQDHARGVAPAFGVVDGVRAGAQWLRRHPEVTVGAAIALIVAKPRAVWRWFKRGVVAWQFWRRGEQWLAATPPGRRT